MADQRIQSTEEMVGNNHPTKGDTLTRHAAIAHTPDGAQLMPVGADIASAGTITIPDGANYAKITGATTIAGINSRQKGFVLTLEFATSLTLTHHATDFIMPHNYDVVVEAGDTYVFVEYNTGKWRLITPVEKPGRLICLPIETVPGGWLECDGSTVSRTTYAALSAEIGITHGQGDGSTTFEIPDYRGRFLRGWDNTAGTDPDAAGRTAMATGGVTGDNVGSVQGYEHKSHNHGLGIKQANGDTPLNSAAASVSQTTSSGHYIGHTLAVTDTNNVVILAKGGNETRPKNVNVMYCIKY